MWCWGRKAWHNTHACWSTALSITSTWNQMVISIMQQGLLILRFLLTESIYEQYGKLLLHNLLLCFLTCSSSVPLWWNLRQQIPRIIKIYFTRRVRSIGATLAALSVLHGQSTLTTAVKVVTTLEVVQIWWERNAALLLIHLDWKWALTGRFGSQILHIGGCQTPVVIRRQWTRGGRCRVRARRDKVSF